jgi:hypothetical protein
MTKICNCCGIEKPISEYHRVQRGKFGVAAICKVCRNAKNIIQKVGYRAKNREILNAKNREYEARNKERIALRKVAYLINNAEKIAANKNIYHAKIKDKRLAYERNKRKTDMQFRIKTALRSRISNFMKGHGLKRGSAIRDLGCTMPEFILHLESKFTEGMTWDNYGKWHIDHIKPLCEFDLTNREQFLEAAHYTNMQPLWAVDNWKKNRFYK